jgi:hypothetical protein
MASLGILIPHQLKLLLRFLINERSDFLGMQSLSHGYCFCNITLVDQLSRDCIPVDFLVLQRNGFAAQCSPFGNIVIIPGA